MKRLFLLNDPLCCHFTSLDSGTLEITIYTDGKLSRLAPPADICKSDSFLEFISMHDQDFKRQRCFLCVISLKASTGTATFHQMNYLRHRQTLFNKELRAAVSSVPVQSSQSFFCMELRMVSDWRKLALLTLSARPVPQATTPDWRWPYKYSTVAAKYTVVPGTVNNVSFVCCEILIYKSCLKRKTGYAKVTQLPEWQVCVCVCLSKLNLKLWVKNKQQKSYTFVLVCYIL